jgi:predicted nucleic acid-binding protein
MLIDTSIWIEFLAPRSRVLSPGDLDQLSELIVEGGACVILPIYTELTSGVKHGDRELRELLKALRYIDLDWTQWSTWDTVADLGQQAYARRLKVPGVVDRMILAATRAAGEPLWALDGPLRRLARGIGVQTR